MRTTLSSLINPAFLQILDPLHGHDGSRPLPLRTKYRRLIHPPISRRAISLCWTLLQSLFWAGLHHQLVVTRTARAAAAEKPWSKLPKSMIHGVQPKGEVIIAYFLSFRVQFYSLRSQGQALAKKCIF